MTFDVTLHSFTCQRYPGMSLLQVFYTPYGRGAQASVFSRSSQVS